MGKKKKSLAKHLRKKRKQKELVNIGQMMTEGYQKGVMEREKNQSDCEEGR